MCLTVVSQQGLDRTLRVGAGGLRASPAGVTNAAVGAAVTLTPHSHVAAVYTPLPPRKHSNLDIQPITLLLALENPYSYLLFQSVHLWTPTALSLEQYLALHLKGEGWVSN